MVLSIYSINILMIGDSVIGGQMIALQNTYKNVVRIKDFKHLSFNMKSIPSTFVSKQSKVRTEKWDYIYMNFAVLHFCHLHPERPLDFSKVEQNLYFEGILRKEIPLLYKYAKHVVVMTPPNICDNLYNDSYALWIQNSDNRIRLCAQQYIQTYSQVFLEKKTSWRPSIYNPLDNMTFDKAQTICRAHTMTSNGTGILTKRLITTVNDLNNAHNLGIKVMDIYNLTKFIGCSHTTDGRHYVTESFYDEVRRLAATIFL